MREPVLAARVIPKGVDGSRVAHTFRVEGGLHYIKGNRKPYFSLTYDMHRKGFPNQSQSGGAGHDTILKYYPRFADLAALHLSDIDGVPSHGVANAWYWMAGALGGAGERYHGGNTELNWPCEPPADKPWKTTEYRKGTPDEVLGIFAKHVRVSLDEAKAIREDVKSKWNYPDMKTRLTEIVEAMKPRWKAEAEACIAAHNLKVYGDPWPESTTA